MLVLILGVAKVGKTRVTRDLERDYHCHVIHTDELRREWGYHEPHKGYYTEIDPNKRISFYGRLKTLIESRKEEVELTVIEGNAIDPRDSDYFNADLVFLLGDNLTHKEKLHRAKKYSDENAWVYRRDDLYLDNLFKFYEKVEEEWKDKYKNIYVDMTQFSKGKEYILSKIKDYMNQEEDIDGSSAVLNMTIIGVYNGLFKKYHGRGKNAYELRGMGAYHYIEQIEREYGEPVYFYKKFKAIKTIIQDIQRYRDKNFMTNTHQIKNYRKLWYVLEQVFENKARKYRK